MQTHSISTKNKQANQNSQDSECSKFIKHQNGKVTVLQQFWQVYPQKDQKNKNIVRQSLEKFLQLQTIFFKVLQNNNTMNTYNYGISIGSSQRLLQSLWLPFLMKIQVWPVKQLKIINQKTRKIQKENIKKNISICIQSIKFQNLTKLHLKNLSLTNIQFISFIDAPNLSQLSLYDNMIKSIKPLNKLRRSRKIEEGINKSMICLKFNHIKQISINRIQFGKDFQRLTEMIADYYYYYNIKFNNADRKKCSIDLRYIVKSQAIKFKRYENQLNFGKYPYLVKQIQISVKFLNILNQFVNIFQK